ncbi:MAG: Coenzyme F420 hydrogenase/dehydrogenase, beta subunit C-terminal domain, partial [Desulfofustis sp.]|nr:Coenzyme F420 hydrogenase/dehydrogenase, beta subunit C-terminal domain [Desulfofustis sp.]
REVLFSGTPCQVAGLKKYLMNDYENLVTVDLICHGVPSPKVYREYISLLQNMYAEEIKKVDFRDKNRGWKLFSFSVFFEKNLYSQSKMNDLFMRGFLACYFLRPSCHICEFKGRNRGSDLTIADYWGVHTKFPEYDDDLGVALVLVNTEKGARVWNEASPNLDVKISDFTHAVKHNLSYDSPVLPHPRREKFFQDLRERNLQEVITEYCGAPDLIPTECGH